jgi:hypothetical protein
MSEENQEQRGTETPVTGTSTPAGGNDPHRDAERAKQSSEDDQGQPVAQTASDAPEEQAEDAKNDAPETKTEDTTDTSNQDANASQEAPTDADQASADEADATQAEADAATAPTPEEQAETDSMVDYTVKEGDNFLDLPDGTKVNVGDTVMLPKDHPLVTGQEEA